MELMSEPSGLEPRFRTLTPAPQSGNVVLARFLSCLAAFAASGGLTLVTFDRALRGKTKPLILLGV